MAGTTRTITTSIKLDGEAEFKKQMSSVNGELKNLSSELKLSESEFKGQANTVEALTAKDKLLKDQIEQQRVKVDALTQAVKDSSEAYGDTDKRTDSYRQQLNNAKIALNNLNGELKDNHKYLDEARKSSDGTAKSIDEFGKSAKEAGKKGLGGMLENLGSLKKMLVGGAIVGGIQAVTGAIFDIVDSTEEYRKVLGTLEVSSKNAGYTTEQTEQTYRKLQSVLGDTQTAATATANLQAIGLSQQDLMTVTDQAIGAWATYGDSIPIDGLAEAINETAKTGTVTGNLADVLNWAGTSEDEFNAKLAAANSTSERANIIMQELSKQGLEDASQAWTEANEDIVATNESQERLNQAWGRVGEALSPVASELRNLGADALIFVADKTEVLIGWLDVAIDRFNELTGAAKSFQDSDVSHARAFGTSGSGDRGSVGFIDGSHALGLDYVPFDGYIAELHKGERILTTQEANVLSGLSSANLKTPSSTLSTSDMQKIASASVNAINLNGAGVASGDLDITFEMNGEKFARATIKDFRKVNKASPEVVSEF